MRLEKRVKVYNDMICVVTMIECMCLRALSFIYLYHLYDIFCFKYNPSNLFFGVAQ